MTNKKLSWISDQIYICKDLQASKWHTREVLVALRNAQSFEEDKLRMKLEYCMSEGEKHATVLASGRICDDGFDESSLLLF